LDFYYPIHAETYAADQNLRFVKLYAKVISVLCSPARGNLLPQNQHLNMPNYNYNHPNRGVKEVVNKKLMDFYFKTQFS
jgi:hypothetical protein